MVNRAIQALVVALLAACGNIDPQPEPQQSELGEVQEDVTTCGAPLPPGDYGEGIDPNKAIACAEAKANANAVCKSVNGKNCCSESACDCGSQPYPNDGGWFCFVYYLTLKP